MTLTKAENRFYRTAADAAEIPQRIECPGLGCRMPAWKLPDGAVYCPESRSLVPEDGAPDQPVGIVCPTYRCDARAWRMPDGRVYCDSLGGVVVELDDQPPAPAAGKPYCWDCKDDPEWPNHGACGDPECGCVCNDEGGSR